MPGQWKIEEVRSMDRTQSPVPTTPFRMKRLHMMAERLQKGTETSRIILNKILDDKELSALDQMEVNKLQIATDEFISEIKDMEKNTPDESVSLQLEEYCKIHLEARDLLSMMNRQESQKIGKTQVTTTSRLPKLDLIKFDGDKLKWHEFWDIFSASVDKRTDLSDADKLAYLMTSLEKGAKEVVRGLTITNNNYKIAVQELTDQFGRPEIVMDAHYRALNKIPRAGNSMTECAKTRTEIERHLKILSSLGEPVDSNNQLRSMIMDKFPESVLYHLRLTMHSKGHSVAVVRQGLKEIISANDETNQPSIFEELPKQTEGRFTTETLFSGGPTYRNEADKAKDNRKHSRPPAGPPTKKTRLSCVFCDDSHYNDECTKYKTLHERTLAIREQRRCFLCFSKEHQARSCPIKARKRKCAHCQLDTHNRALCPSKFGTKTETTTNLLSQAEKNTILQTAMAEACKEQENQHIEARLLFDTGSQKSYITEKMAKKLELKTVEHLDLTIYTFGKLHPNIVKTRLVNVFIKTPDEENLEIQAHVIPNITGSIPSFASAKGKVKAIHPTMFIAPDAAEDRPADILIGNDYYHSLISGRTVEIQSGLYLLESKLGWILSGRVALRAEEETLSLITYVQGEHNTKKRFTVPDLPLQDDKIKDLWELECIGIRDSPKVLEDDEIIKFFHETTKFSDGRYHVRWPWSQYPSDLPINFGLALGRLSSLLKRTNPATLEQYDQVLKDQLAKGMIEIVKEKKLPNSHPVHYLPHHCVCQENKTTKLRIVYDASSKLPGHCSLNEYLFKGPLMLEDLVQLLLSFRIHPIGIIADIEKAFLQVGLQTTDRDVCRFLWVKNTREKAEGDNLVHLRFCRVPFGVISSPYLLAATVKHHLLLQNSKDSEKISTSLYVDNLITGAMNSQEATSLFNSAVSAFDSLSMNIREWNSNSPEFMKNIPNDKKASASDSTNPKVLGLIWDITEDSLKISLDPAVIQKPISTKREILRIVASIYDPCGLIAPLVLKAKIFLQNLWQEKFKWDTPLPAAKREEWNECLSALILIQSAKFPRYYFQINPIANHPSPTTPTQIQLHCFTDASKDAYSAVVYIRAIMSGEPVSNIVMSRTRLVPIKNKQQYTIPKLELLGVLIGTRLILYVQRALQIPVNDLYLWTDSMIVLGWLKSNHLLQPFVSKRISEIKAANGLKFRYLTSENNPADLATRAQCSPLSTIWIQGPPLLQQSETEWAQQPQHEELNHCLVSSVEDDTTTTLLGQTMAPQDIDPPDSERTQPDITTAPENFGESVSSQDLIITNSKNDCIKRIQLQHFPKDALGKSSPLKKSLGVFVDHEGILRCSGRLQNANLPYNQTHPILLPKADPFTLNLIKQIHCENHHVGVSHTLALLREKYWVPSGRAQVEYVIKRCPQCIKYGGGPYQLPPMPPLPKERVQLCSPFTYCGLDYLGPLTIKHADSTQKRWCCIFTCMASRAIRLETVKDLTAEEFLLCLRRFIATQGPPLLIVSDNAAQFKLAAEIITSPIAKQHNIAWNFIPELSPWQGGFYERLVALVKHCLRRSIDKTLLTEWQLVTILKEIETILNSRPLTYVGKELDVVLKPSDFMNNCNTHPFTPSSNGSTSSITATKQDLIENWKKGKAVLKEFESLFKSRYLPNLRERALKPHKQNRVVSKKQPKVGDVVQIWDGHSKTSHRQNWKVGKITSLLPSKDGLVRTAQVKLENDTILNRSISYLYPLELDENDEGPIEPETPESTPHVDESQPIDLPIQETEEQSNEDNSIEHCVDANAAPTSNTQYCPHEIPKSRPVRSAATAARKTIRQWTEDLCALAAIAQNKTAERS